MPKEKEDIIAQKTKELKSFENEMSIIKDVFGNTHVFYINYKDNKKLSRLRVDTDSIYSFISSCKTETQLTEIYKKIEQLIGTEMADKEWDDILDGFIDVYNQNNGSSLRRQIVNINSDEYDRETHSSIEYSTDGEIITGALLCGIVNGITGSLFNGCRSRVTTKRTFENSKKLDISSTHRLTSVAPLKTPITSPTPPIVSPISPITPPIPSITQSFDKKDSTETKGKKRRWN